MYSQVWCLIRVNVPKQDYDKIALKPLKDQKEKDWFVLFDVSLYAFIWEKCIRRISTNTFCGLFNHLQWLKSSLSCQMKCLLKCRLKASKVLVTCKEWGLFPQIAVVLLKSDVAEYKCVAAIWVEMVSSCLEKPVVLTLWSVTETTVWFRM